MEIAQKSLSITSQHIISYRIRVLNVVEGVEVTPPLFLQWHVSPPHRHLLHVQLTRHLPVRERHTRRTHHNNITTLTFVYFVFCVHTAQNTRNTHTHTHTHTLCGVSLEYSPLSAFHHVDNISANGPTAVGVYA